MNLKTTLTFFFFSFIIKANAQIWEKPKIDIGFIARDEIDTYLDGREKRNFFSYNDPTFGGGSIAFVGANDNIQGRFLLDLTQKLPGKNNITIAFSNAFSFSKDRALKKIITDPRDAYTKRYKRDHFIDVINSFNTKNKSLKFIVGIGAGLMNCGTNFKIEPIGPLAYISSDIIGTDRNFATRLQVGIQKFPFKMMAVGSYIGREQLSYPKLSLEWKIAYTISPFAKKGHAFELPKIKLPVVGKTKLNTPKIEVGIAFRFKPIEIKKNRYSGGGFNSITSTSYLDINPRLYLGIKECISKKKNLHLTLSNYITSARVGFKKSNTDNFFYYKNVVKLDHFLDFSKEFKPKNNKPHLIIGVGAGAMNVGTNYTFINNIYDITRTYITAIDSNAKADQVFFAQRFFVGLQKNKYNATLVFNRSTNEIGERSLTLWGEARLTYTIDPFKNKK